MKIPTLLFKVKVPSKTVKGKMYIMEVYTDGNVLCTEEGNTEGCMASQMGRVCNHKIRTYLMLKEVVKVMDQRYGKDPEKLEKYKKLKEKVFEK